MTLQMWDDKSYKDKMSAMLLRALIFINKSPLFNFCCK